MTGKQASLIEESPVTRVPLAHRLRPERLEDFVGQQNLTGKDAWLAAMLREGRATSCIFWGPPGVGKTTLALMMARRAGLPVAQLSAVSAGKAEIREVVQRARQRNETWLLFLDEIHRFNKAQQDVLLPYIEDGTLILVGATTENPSFSLNDALLSRCRLVVLKPLSSEDIERIVQRGCAELARRSPAFALTGDARRMLAKHSHGDARYALNQLEALHETRAGRWNAEQVARYLATRAARYDRAGDAHYDLISALHKSVRDSDPDAACYWLARMLEGGEEPLYLARRLIRMASEDVGLADPRALTVALDALRMYEVLGSPEGEQGLFEAAVYLALAPKSNALYMAEKAARKLARETSEAEVPMHLRNAPTRVMRELGYGRGYQYAHDAPDAVVSQRHFPDQVPERTLYSPVDRGFERTLGERLRWLKARRRAQGRDDA
ncbi:MAG: replication-associated recombination protein A [Zetaproteobacteria bacterium]|nr:MAG: replication-associated recombination protein A [Zetaproteobacteria bacterium]